LKIITKANPSTKVLDNFFNSNKFYQQLFTLGILARMGKE